MAVELAFILVVAAPLALVTSLLLLQRFLRAVKRSMARPGGTGAPTPQPVAAPEPPATALGFEEITGNGGRGAWRRRRVGVVYLLAGVVYAAIMASVFLAWASAPGSGAAFDPASFVVLALIYLWPGVLAAGLATAVTWREWAGLAALYLAALLAAAMVNAGVEEGLFRAGFLWIPNALGTLLLAVFLARPVRAVGPMTLVFMAALVAGTSLAFAFVGADDGQARLGAQIAIATGVDVSVVLSVFLVLGAVLMGVLGWLALRGVGALYRAGLITDQTLTIDAAVLFLALVHAVPIANREALWLLAGVGAFVAFKVVTLIGFALARGKADPGAPRLLLLRVFSLGKRSERLFDQFSKLWRRRGSIRMIAGPDLATSNVEPHEFLAFLHGRLARRFIADAEGLARQMAEEDEERRFDGRYGVAEFFCHDDTWTMALRRLVRESDAVLMDLRGFTPANQGCIYEVEALLDLSQLSRVTFVIDDTTDEAFLHQTLLAGWAKTSADSPNRMSADPRARLYRLGGRGQGPFKLAAAVAASAQV